MQNLVLKADLGLGSGKYFITLSLIEFIEDNVTIIFSPALDLSGYGYNSDEAKICFDESLKEFFKYTHNKKTLTSVLKQLGWKISGSAQKPKFKPPKNSELVNTNEFYNDIINNKQHRTFTENLEFA